jgi:hypothetical protein
VEQGTHTQLISKAGLYANLIRIQNVAMSESGLQWDQAGS